MSGDVKPPESKGIGMYELAKEHRQSKEMAKVLEWASENVVSVSICEDGWWVSVATNGAGSCKYHNLSTLYQALYEAWSKRDE